MFSCSSDPPILICFCGIWSKNLDQWVSAVLVIVQIIPWLGPEHQHSQCWDFIDDITSYTNTIDGYHIICVISNVGHNLISYLINKITLGWTKETKIQSRKLLENIKTASMGLRLRRFYHKTYGFETVGDLKIRCCITSYQIMNHTPCDDLVIASK